MNVFTYISYEYCHVSVYYFYDYTGLQILTLKKYCSWKVDFFIDFHVLNTKIINKH